MLEGIEGPLRRLLLPALPLPLQLPPPSVSLHGSSLRSETPSHSKEGSKWPSVVRT
jgi:hypothetical protein